MKAPWLAAHFRRWRAGRRALVLRLLVAAPVVDASGCAGGPGRILRAQEETARHEAAQSRRFEGITRPEMLTACSALLQDLGFTIESGDSRLGLLEGSKQHTAVVEKRVSEAVLEAAAVVALTLAIGAVTGHLMVGPADDDPTDRQVIRVTLTVRAEDPGNPTRVVVNVAMNRVVYTRSQQIRHQESVHDPVLVQAFFEALSQSVFLEAHAV